MDDILRPEYDLKSLRVRCGGVRRATFGGVLVPLDADVAAAFPDAIAVNTALRAFIKASDKKDEPPAAP